MQRHHHPPRLARKFLLKFLRDDIAEEVLGDLDEKFDVVVKRRSPRRAKINYWFQVFNYLRPFAIRKSKPAYSNHYDMLQNYFKIGWRNMTRQKMYSLIKVGGFALGIAACILIFLYIKDELGYDRHFPDKDRIFRIVVTYKDDTLTENSIWFQAPFAGAIKEDYPDIEKVGRLLPVPLFGAGSNEVRRADKQENFYEEGFTYADQELLDILSIPFIQGSPVQALASPNTIIISKRKAEKFFPGEDPIGKILVLNNNNDRSFTITGVYDNFPATSHLQYDFIMTLKGVNFYPGEQTNWGATNYPTYVLLRQGVDPTEFEKKLYGTVEKYWLPTQLAGGMVNAREIAKRISFRAQPITDIHLRSEQIDDRLIHGDIRFIWLFGAVAIFILLLAIINFVNLSTAKSANRAKEVGIRKVVGSVRAYLIRQFLTESLLYSMLSFSIGLFLAWALLPFFNSLAVKSLVFPWTEWWLLPIVLGAMIVVGIFAGLYPSFYLSAFTPIQVLKGNLSRGSKTSKMRSALVIFQFTTSIILIIGTFIIFRQMNFLLNKKVGFDKEQVVLIHGTNTLGKQVTTFRDALAELPGIQSAAISDYLPIAGTKRNGNTFWKEGKIQIDRGVSGQRWIVDHQYVETLGIRIVDGRNFSATIASDSTGVVINQAMAKELGLANPVGQRITNGELFTVIGVVENFNFESMREDIGPLMMELGLSPSIVSVRASTHDISQVLESINSAWKKFSPHQSIRYTFLDDSFALMYEDVQRTGRIFTTFAVLAIIVACLGLFALSAFMVEQRGKEVSIRLIMGASVRNIFYLLTNNFFVMIIVSLAIAIPISWYFMEKWLKDFAYKITITWEVFVLSGAIVLVIALVTISYQSVKAALVNPVRNLRSE
jgi:putative ABC transport system permease protein